MTFRNRLLKHLYYGRDPFSNFFYEKDELDPQGWNSTHKYFEECIRELKPNLIVECGVWKGGSTIHMAKLLKEVNPQGVVVAIDTFLGDFILAEVQEWQPSLRRGPDGRPNFYRTFYANVIEAGLQDMIVPIHMDTVSGLRYLKRQGYQSELIHHDACHQEGDVYHEMDLCWDIISKGGYLMVDDYSFNDLPEGHANNFDGLIRDVDKFAKASLCEFKSDPPKALLKKPI